MDLSQSEFNELSRHIYRLCALDIKDEKHYLVQQRLEPLAKSVGSGSFGGLLEKLKSGDNETLRNQVIEAITTNETSFFRDGHPFEAFSEIVLPSLAEIIKRRASSSHHRIGPKINIWCAASSTGQEPYSVAMLIHEFASQKGRGVVTDDFEIIATDISPKVLAQAISGTYNDMEIKRGLSDERREKYFKKEGGSWVIDGGLRDMVEFRRINLAEPFTRLGGVDVIFCRNVLIYFNEETKQRIFEQFHQMLSDSGYLILGAMENAAQIPGHFSRITHKNSVIHQRNGK